MTRADEAYDWGVAAIIVVVILYVLATMIISFVGNTLFVEMLFGGGVLAAILYGAKSIFE